jgi:hypothetical protein
VWIETAKWKAVRRFRRNLRRGVYVAQALLPGLGRLEVPGDGPALAVSTNDGRQTAKRLEAREKRDEERTNP